MMYVAIAVSQDPDGDEFEYSGTYIENYNHNNLPTIETSDMWDEIDGRLGSEANWFFEFVQSETQVTENSFKQGSGFDSEDADFHFHHGHGADDDYDIEEEIALHDWNDDYWDHEGDVKWDEVENEWGDGDNEWMAIVSCDVLSDYNYWYRALDDSHLIFGFLDAAYYSPSLWDGFFSRAIGWNDPLSNSWDLATKSSYNSYHIRCGVLSRIEQQLHYDHLWYEGFVVPDDYPSWGETYYLDWWWTDA